MSGPQLYGQAPPHVDTLPPGAVLIGQPQQHHHLPPGVVYSPQPPAIYGGAPSDFHAHPTQPSSYGGPPSHAPTAPSEFHAHPTQPSSYDFDDETPQHLHMNDAHTHVHQPGRWKHELCGCECKGECCISFWLHPAQTAKLHSLSNGDRPPGACLSQASTFWMVGGLVLLGIGDIVAAASPAVASVGGVGAGLLIAQHMFTRFRIARRLGVRESCCCTCLASFFCMGCSSVQMTDSLVSNGEPAARLFMS